MPWACSLRAVLGINGFCLIALVLLVSFPLSSSAFFSLPLVFLSFWTVGRSCPINQRVVYELGDGRMGLEMI